MKCFSALLLVLVLITPFGANAAALKKPVIVKSAPVVSPIARIGEEIAIHGKYLYNTTRVTFTGDAVATDVREYAGTLSSDGHTMLKDRILLTVPPGARDGDIEVCNGTKCAVIKKAIDITSDVNAASIITLVEPNKQKTYDPKKKMTVKFSIENWKNQGVAVYLLRYDGNPKGPSPYFLGSVASKKKSFSFVPASLQNAFVSYPGNIYKIKVCNNPYCEMMDVSEEYFGFKPKKY